MSEALAGQKHFFIGFNFFVDRLAIMKLIAAVSTVRQQAASVTLCLSSPGGSTEQAFYAYEILRALPIPVHTFNLGIVQSAANILFMAGEQRSAVPGANFLFHETRFSPPVGGNYTAAELEFTAASAKQDDARIALILSAGLGKPLSEVQGWFSGQELRTVDFAKEHGIIQWVKPLEMPEGSEFFQVLL